MWRESEGVGLCMPVNVASRGLIACWVVEFGAVYVVTAVWVTIFVRCAVLASQESAAQAVLQEVFCMELFA